MHHHHELFTIPDNIEARWINPENPQGARAAGGTENCGRKGRPNYGQLKSGDTVVMADYSGTSGVVRHIWTTVDKRTPEVLQGLKIEVFWDGAETPAISCPYSDFFGMGLGKMAPFECCFFNNPEGRNFNSHIPMPFRKGFKITVTNQSNTDLDSFWAHVDLTAHDPIGPDTPYLHAVYNRQNPTVLREDYEFLPQVTGRGRYLGCHFGVRVDTETYFKTWWGEGEVKLFVDDDAALPTLCGTGTEDYICTSWGQGKYECWRYGCPVADEEAFEYCFYRYHPDDPIYFRQSIRGTIQQIGCWDPVGRDQMKTAGRKLVKTGDGTEFHDLSTPDVSDYNLFERADEWSSCAYLYLDQPGSIQ